MNTLSLDTNFTVYQIIPDREAELRFELEMAQIPILMAIQDLFICPHSSFVPIWTQNIWEKAYLIPIVSIGDAAKKLKAIQKYWHHHPIGLVRRGTLIQTELQKMKAKNLQFLDAVPTVSLGHWCLLPDGNILASSTASSPFPDGEIHFNEDKFNPPSRAYLKLWETFTLHCPPPPPGTVSIDMGACPGGWTWVLTQLGHSVISIDKAPIDKKLLENPMVQFKKESAFGLNPKNIPHIDWFFSDIICYPEKLYELVLKWKHHFPNLNFVCTLKFQKETDFKTIEKFKAIENSKLIHLFHNKHEITWIHQPGNITKSNG